MKSSIVLSVEPGVIPQGLGGDFEQNARFIAGLGFDGAELLVVNISEVDTKRIRKIAERYRLTIPAVAAGQYYKAHGLSLATSNTEIRKKTMHKIKEFLRFTAEFNSSYMKRLK